MSTFTVSLPDDRLQALKELASQLNISPEELVRLSVEEILTRPKETFRQTIEYVLEKNSELYQRLAV
ncbi:MAG TPA: DNA-binding protein [Thermoflexia bacterium]|nr:DNA-binding protein [Thermoflexia bacterium]